MNVFTATARLGRDAEVRHTASQNTVAGMPLAVDFGFGDGKGTMWLDASLWGKRAESGLIQYLVKGQQVAVSGEQGQRKYTNKDGIEVTVTTLKIAEIELVGGKPEGQQSRPAPQPQQQAQQSQQTRPQQQQSPAQQQRQPDPVDDFDSDIPF
jgi:single-strand DNA-binding protein